ncbi:hypothetical protein [Rhizobium leguminosarum]|uniref:hypothetical protein n=1 Tax=Rhizobium leguminosarum TaxID=384 RepID=UPI002E10BCAE|nr:hypothetical protein U8Q02_41435 [Rhizobium leguminosarum]
MIDENYYAHFKSAVVKFAGKDGFVGEGGIGLAISGADPQAGFGIYIEAIIEGSPDCPLESYWLKVTTSRSDNEDRPFETIAFSEKSESMEQMLLSIVRAHSDRSMRFHEVPGEFVGYHNHAQIVFDEDTPEGAVEGLKCAVRSTVDGFFLMLQVSRDGDPRPMRVSTVQGSFSPDGQEELRQIAWNLHNWAEEHRAAVWNMIAENEAGSRPAP